MKTIEGDFDPTRLPDTSCATLDAAVATSLNDQPTTDSAADSAPAGRSTAPLKIAGEQNIRTAAELHRTLSEHVGRGPDLVVDLSGVQECDTTLLQLICSLRKTADLRKEHFDIVSVSPEVAAVAAALGLRLEALSCPPTGTVEC